MPKNPYLKKATGKGDSPVRATKAHGLGRGLDTLISAKPPVEAVAPAVAASPAAEAAKGGVLELNIADIQRSPYQPRHDFKPEVLSQLAESLKANGLVQPPTVRKNAKGEYELIAGERRLRAALLAGWKKIAVNLIVADDLTAAAMTATENIQREDLNPVEEALSYKTLLDGFGLTQQEVADKVGKGRATVANSLRLLELPDEVKNLLEGGLISTGHAKVLLSVEDEKNRILLARDAVNSQLSVKALETRVARLKAPVVERVKAVSDLPETYVRHLTDSLRKHLGCAVRLTPGQTFANGRHAKGLLEIDFFDNTELDRIIRMIGLEVE